MNEVQASAEVLWVRAARALEARSQPAPLGEFWHQISALAWARLHQEPAECGVELARLGPEAVVALRLRFRQLELQLKRAIELWELQNEEQLGLPAELAQAIREHVIGLGEIPYGAALQGPWRVQHRADRDDYLEGFGRSFDEALQRCAPEQLEAALAPETRSA